MASSRARGTPSGPSQTEAEKAAVVGAVGVNEADTDGARERDGLDARSDRHDAAADAVLRRGVIFAAGPVGALAAEERAAGGARYRPRNSAGFERPAAHPRASRLRTLRSEVLPLEAGLRHRHRPAHLARQDAHSIRNPSISNRAPRAVPEPESPPADADHFAAQPPFALHDPVGRVQESGAKIPGTTAAGHPPSRGHDLQHALAGTARRRRIFLRLRHQTRAETLDFHAGALEGVTILRPTTIGRIEDTRPGPRRDDDGDELPIVVVEVA